MAWVSMERKTSMSRRKLVLKTRPDKLPVNTHDRKANIAFAELIAAWQLVREHGVEQEEEQ
jgi:hypothetical protein